MNDNHLCIGGGYRTTRSSKAFNHSGCSILPAFPYATSLSKASSQGLSRRRHQLIWTGSCKLSVVELYTYSTQGIARSQAFQAAGR